MFDRMFDRVFVKVLWATTPSKRNSEVSLLVPAQGSTYNYAGGAMNAVSLGEKGWMACGLGPDKHAYTDAAHSTIGVIRLPQTHTAFAEDHAPLPSDRRGVHDPNKCLEKGKFDKARCIVMYVGMCGGVCVDMCVDMLPQDCCAAASDSGCADGYVFFCHSSYLFSYFFLISYQKGILLHR